MPSTPLSTAVKKAWSRLICFPKLRCNVNCCVLSVTVSCYTSAKKGFFVVSWRRIPAIFHSFPLPSREFPIGLSSFYRMPIKRGQSRIEIEMQHITEISLFVFPCFRYLVVSTNSGEITAKCLIASLKTSVFYTGIILLLRGPNLWDPCWLWSPNCNS